MTRARPAANGRHTPIGRPPPVTIDCGRPWGSVHWAPRSMPRWRNTVAPRSAGVTPVVSGSPDHDTWRDRRSPLLAGVRSAERGDPRSLRVSWSGDHDTTESAWRLVAPAPSGLVRGSIPREAEALFRLVVGRRRHQLPHRGDQFADGVIVAADSSLQVRQLGGQLLVAKR